MICTVDPSHVRKLGRAQNAVAVPVILIDNGTEVFIREIGFVDGYGFRGGGGPQPEQKDGRHDHDQGERQDQDGSLFHSLNLLFVSFCCVTGNDLIVQ